MKLIIPIIILGLTFFEKNEVLICVSSGATKYHSHECQGLKRCKNTIEKVSIKEAIQRGYEACGYCY